jgi:hypothetical protein
VTVAALDANAAETTNGPADTATFRITREGNTNVDLNVNYSLIGAAMAGVDYAALPGHVALSSGVLTADVVITPLNDAAIEGNESVTLMLEPSGITTLPLPPEAYVIGTASNATATIFDNDFDPPPTVTITEPGPNAIAIVGQPVTVSFTASDVNGYITHYAVSGGVSFVSGTNDSLASTVPGAPFTASASLVFSNRYTQPYSVRVVDNDGIAAVVTRTIYVTPPPPPAPSPPGPPARYEIFALDADAAETGPGEAPNAGKFLFVRTGVPGDLELFSYSFIGTARQGVDYTVSYGEATYTTNELLDPVLRQEITIIPVDDLLIEGTETVKMQLCFPIIAIIYGVGAPIGVRCTGDSTNANAFAMITIRDNDTVPPPFSVVSVAATDADAAEVPPQSGEPPNTGVFTITRTAPRSDALSVNYSLSRPPQASFNTSSRVAENGVDYTMLSGTAIIPAGANSVQVVIAPIYDMCAEGDETVTLTLEPSSIPLPHPSSYLVDAGAAATAATVTVRDYAPTNIPVVTLNVTDPVAVEQLVRRRNASMLMTRRGGTTGSLTVPYAISGSASNGLDYATLSGQATFAPGTNGSYILITPLRDGLVEKFESIVLTLQPPPDTYPPPYLLGQPRSGGATIHDGLSRRFFPRRFRSGHFVLPVPVEITTTNIATGATSTNDAPCWIIEASPDLVTWQQIGISDATTAAGPVDNFVDADSASQPTRFYRARPCPTTAP